MYNTREMSLMSNKYYNYASDNLARLSDHRTSTAKLGVFLIVLAVVFVLPILLANVDYVDDLARRVSGYYGWSELGRHGMQYIMHILTFSFSHMPSVGSLGQVLSVVPLSLAGFVAMTGVAKSMGYRESRIPTVFILIGAVVILNAPLVANLAFRYDGFAMMFSYYLSIHAGVIATTTHRSTQWLLASAMTIAAAFIYQPMILMFLVVAVAILFIKTLYAKKATGSFKSTINLVAVPIIVFLGSTVIYFVLMKFLVTLDSGGPRGELVPLNYTGVVLVYQNIITAWSKYLLVFSPFAIKLTLILSTIISAMIVVSFLIASRRRAFMKIVAISIVLIVLFFAILGPFALMISNLTVQYRTLASGIVILILISVAGIYGLLKGGVLTRVLSIVLSTFVALLLLYSLGYAYTFGALLTAQRNYDESVYSRILLSLERDVEDYAEQTYSVGGYANSPAEVLNTFNKRPSMKFMEIAGDNSIWYIWTTLVNNGVGQEVNWYTFKSDEEKDRFEHCRVNSKPVSTGHGYTIHYLDDHYVIWISGPNSPHGDYCAN